MDYQATLLQFVVDFLDKVFCQQDIPYIVGHLSENISWMGEDLISTSYDEICLRILNEQKWYPDCEIGETEFEVDPLTDYLYSINGTYAIQPREGTQGRTLRFKASFILDISGGSHRFCLFHYNPVTGSSNPKAMQDNQDFENRQLNIILQSIQGGITVSRYAPNLPIIYVSDQLPSMLGYSRQEFLQVTRGQAMRLIYPPDLSKVIHDCQNILRQKNNSFSTKFRVICKDGNVKWIVNTGNVVTLKTGERLVNCFYLDVTDSETIHFLAEEQNDLLNSIYESIQCGIIRWRILPNNELEYVSINKAAWMIMGYESEEACRMDGPANFIKHLDPEHVERYHKQLLALRDEDEYIEEEALIDCVDGKKRWISGSTRIIHSSQDDYILQITLMDTTRQRQLERKLQEEQAEIRRLQNARHTRIFQSEYNTLTNINLEDGSYEREIFSRPSFASMKDNVGFYPMIFEDMVLEVYPEDQEKFRNVLSFETFQNIVRSGHIPESNSVSYRMNSQGNDLWLESTAFFIQDGDNISVSVTNRDITSEMLQRQLLEDALRAAENANQAKSNFLSRMSHDVRTPLNAIMGMTDIATSHFDDKERVADCLEKIKSSSKLLLGIINEVLDMSRIESGKVTLSQDPFHITELLNNLIAMVRPLLSEKQHELIVHDTLVTHDFVIGDTLRLQQIFMNILSNAIKYTPPQGHISIGITEKTSDILGYGCYEFVFQDDGIGMSEEFQEHIFEPFTRETTDYTIRAEGTGLGMSISQNLVRMMQGRIDVESQVGKGSKFTVIVYLKYQTDSALLAIGAEDESAAADATNSAEELRKAMLPLKGKRILLVEDNELNMEIAETLLTDIGLVVEKAWNGKEAYEAFTASPSGYYDLIFMDIQMPVWNGYQATNAIRHSNRPDSDSIPIIAMTANAFVEDIQNAHNARMNEHIAKPLNPQEIYQALKRWIS